MEDDGIATEEPDEDVVESATPGAMIDQWLADVWRRAHSVEIATRPDPFVSEPHPAAALVVLADPGEMSQFKALVSAGWYRGDIVRSMASRVVRLVGADGRTLAEADFAPTAWISWDRDRFRNDFMLDDPLGTTLFLAGRGLDRDLEALVPVVAARLGLEEGEEQFRPVGAGPEVMASRGVPECLWAQVDAMVARNMHQVSDTQVEALDAVLRAQFSEPARRARALLAWLGTLTWPAEALSGDGVLVRRLLDRLETGVVLSAFDGTTDPALVMGGLAWAVFARQTAEAATGLEPGLAALKVRPDRSGRFAVGHEG